MRSSKNGFKCAFFICFFHSKDKEPLKPKNMLKLAHQAIWDQTRWSASAAQIWLALLTSLYFKNEFQNELEMQILLAFILNLNSLATPTLSPLGGILRGCSSQEWGGLRGRAEHTIPLFAPLTSTSGTGVWDEAPQLPKMVRSGCWGEKRNGETWRNLHPSHKNPSIPSSTKHCANKRWIIFYIPKTPKLPKSHRLNSTLKAPKSLSGEFYLSTDLQVEIAFLSI